VATRRFELGSQTRRSAFSVAANIVEGCAREHKQERLQMLDTSRASLAEVGYCLHVAHKLAYLNADEFAALDLAVRQVAAPLNGFIEAVRTGKAR
jgi:four helix bundle protein